MSSQAGSVNQEKSGLGAGGSTEEEGGSEDPFETYRKRMMLGYKHRPNPRAYVLLCVTLCVCAAQQIACCCYSSSSRQKREKRRKSCQRNTPYIQGGEVALCSALCTVRVTLFIACSRLTLSCIHLCVVLHVASQWAILGRATTEEAWRLCLLEQRCHFSHLLFRFFFFFHELKRSPLGSRKLLLTSAILPP